jgi:hypothetical protein
MSGANASQSKFRLVKTRASFLSAMFGLSRQFFPRNRAVSVVASTSFPETTPELAATAPLFRVYHSPE